MSNIEDLLRRQYEGSITPEEQSELDCLTHRSQVIAAATRRAKVLRRRQLAGVTGVASILLVAGLIFFVHPTAGEMKTDSRVVAKTDIPEMPVTTEVEAEQQPAAFQERPASDKAINAVQDGAVPVSAPSVAVSESAPTEALSVEKAVSQETFIDVPPTTITRSEPVVACNTACSPDSVISDIWKFLNT